MAEVAARQLRVSLVSADAEIWSGAATMVVARTKVGQIGILPGHEPVLAILDEGEVRVTLPSGEKISANAVDGFLSVDHDTVTIVARDASLAN
jgi:F-type H+-transporting ATPase subunit epsilon